jgi:hypothetical protein
MFSREEKRVGIACGAVPFSQKLFEFRDLTLAVAVENKRGLGPMAPAAGGCPTALILCYTSDVRKSPTTAQKGKGREP